MERLVTPLYAIYALFGAWVVSWHLAMMWTAPAAATDPSPRRYVFLAVTVAGFAMMFAGARGSGLGQPAWQVPEPAAWALVAVAAAGIAFMWWARIHLGPLWSGGIVTRQNHRVVDNGPYRLVRHPIYTGLFLMVFALAAVKATPLALGGAVLVVAAFVAKAHAEEDFLSRELGEAYARYRARVPMLVPFPWP